jgi:Ca2+-binding RTX toxin-like protein
MIRFFIRLTAFGLAALIVLSISIAVAATNTVGSTRVKNIVLQSPITANMLKPSYCTMNLTQVVFVTGTTQYNDNTGNSLILGNAANNKIANKTQRSDCILAGGGNDTITGNGTNNGDVCDGGPGSDSASKCTTTLNVP